MVARVINVEVSASGDPEKRTRNLKETVIPRLRQASGFVAAYWLQGADGNNMAVLLFDDAKSEAANEAEAAPMREKTFAELGLRVRNMNTYEVIAHT